MYEIIDKKEMLNDDSSNAQSLVFGNYVLLQHHSHSLLSISLEILSDFRKSLSA